MIGSGSLNSIKTQTMDSLAVREFFQSLKRKQAPTEEQQMVNSLAIQEEVQPSKQTFKTYVEAITPMPKLTSASWPAWYISPNPQPIYSKRCSQNSEEIANSSDTTDFVITSPSSQKSKNISYNVATHVQDIFSDIISTKKCKHLVNDRKRVSTYTNVKYDSFQKLPLSTQNYRFSLSSIIDTFGNKGVENSNGGETREDTLNHLVDDSVG